MADTAPEGESIQNKDTDVDIAPTEDAGMLDGATDTTFTERLTHEIKMADAAQEELSVHNKDTDLEIEATEDVGMLDKSDSAITYTTFKERLTHDVDFRRKFILWLALCFSAGIMGWVIGQLGPSLLDLKEITNISLDQASFFITSTFIGYLIGTTITGAIYERMNPFLLLFVGLVFLAGSSATIPWCSLYVIMIAMHILKGFGFGVLDTAANSVFMAKFKDEKKIQSYMQTIHLMFAVGGFLSPIATAPFLMVITVPDNPDCSHLMNNSLHHCNSTSVQPANNRHERIIVTNSTGVTLDFVHNDTATDKYIVHNDTTSSNYIVHNDTASDRQHDSVLYQAYLISTALCLLVAVPFFFMYFQNRGLAYKDKSNMRNDIRKLPLSVRYGILLLMCLVLAVDNGMEDAYFGMFSTFIVQELGWTKKNGSYATSLYWGSFALGRLSAIFYGSRFKASKLFRYYITLFLAAMIGLFLSTVFVFHVGIWIFLPVMGFAVSVFFPSVFLWTEADFMSVTGRVSSFLMLSASLGSMINPILIGFLMDKFDSMWFMYVTLADGIVLWVLVWVATYMSRYVKQYKNIEIEIEIDKLDESPEKL